MELETDILVLGGGITGLYAAHCLRQKGLKAAVLEKEARSGGLCSTVNFGGSFFDLGGHRLYLKNHRLKKEILGLLGEENLLQHRRKSAICSGNSFFSYPPDVRSFYFFISRLFSEGKSGRNRPAGPGDSLEAWLVANYGRKIYETYFEEYTEKAWGLPASRIAAVWAEKRIDKAGLFRLVFDAVLKLGEVKENASVFYYPRVGIGALPEALEKASGAETHFGVSGLKIIASGKKAEAAEFEKNGQKIKISFRQLLSTIPVAELLPSLEKGGAKGFAAKAEGIRYRSLIVAFVEGERNGKLPYHWVYFPEKNVFFSRACELSNWSEESAGSSAFPLTFEIFCDHRDGIWEMKDGELVEKILRDSSALPGLAMKKAERYKVLRLKYAYPLLYLGYEKALDEALKSVSGFGNIHVCGRSGRHSYYDIEECLLDAAAVSEKIASGPDF